jgi:pimeloyl-ACP methyl ester carboxylesterase
MAQIAHQLRCKTMARDHLIEVFRARGDEGMVRRLEAAPMSMEAGASEAWMRLRDRAMHEAGVGHMHHMRSVVTGILLPMWRVRAYTLPEKVNIGRGKIWSRPFFWEDLLRDDLSARLTRFELPVYFFIGRHDYTANADLSRAYCDAIEAPVKGFYLFAGFAHSPLFEEPARARQILLTDVLGGKAALADSR